MASQEEREVSEPTVKIDYVDSEDTHPYGWWCNACLGAFGFSPTETQARDDWQAHVDREHTREPRK